MFLNIIGFKISWLGLLSLGQVFIPSTFLWLGFHLYRCKFIAAETKLIMSITFIGIIVDSTMQFVGILIFPNQFIPLWLVALWAAFAATIAHSLNFLTDSKQLQLLVGFVFAPLSYIGGASLSSVELGYSWLTTYLVIGFTWSVLMVLFFYLKQIFYKEEPTNA